MGHAHNIFLQIALDSGLPGLVAYIALLLVAFGMALVTVRRWVPIRPIIVGLCSSLLALHIYGLTDALALGSKTGVIFWLSLGLITAAYQQSKKVANVSQNPG
jgi:putative inorganic carbon (HCO3(-)) transporter